MRENFGHVLSLVGNIKLLCFYAVKIKLAAVLCPCARIFLCLYQQIMIVRSSQLDVQLVQDTPYKGAAQLLVAQQCQQPSSASSLAVLVSLLSILIFRPISEFFFCLGHKCKFEGAITLSIMTFSIMTLGIKGLFSTLSITTLPLC